MAEILEERCEVREDGIYLIYVTEDEEIENLILPKNTFVEAFKKYILPKVYAETPVGENLVQVAPITMRGDNNDGI